MTSESIATERATAEWQTKINGSCHEPNFTGTFAGVLFGTFGFASTLFRGHCGLIFLLNFHDLRLDGGNSMW